MPDWLHRHQIGRIARRDLRGKTRIAGPGDDVDLEPYFGVFRLEAVDHRRQDAAFGLGLGNVDTRAIDRASFAEKALDDGRGAAVALPAGGQQQGGEQHDRPLHRTAAPAMARTICFWNTT